jgi:hypothetical protein
MAAGNQLRRACWPRRPSGRCFAAHAGLQVFARRLLAGDDDFGARAGDAGLDFLAVVERE